MRRAVGYPSCQRGQTGNLLAYHFTGSNPGPTTTGFYSRLCRRGQSEIIFLVSAAEDVAARELPFMFTDGHAIISYVNHYNRLEDLPKLHWNVIKAPYWNNFVDGRCRRQAEFLVKDRFPLELVQEIGVRDEEMRERVADLIGPTVFQPLIRMR